jgi:hypothetical protein
MIMKDKTNQLGISVGSGSRSRQLRNYNSVQLMDSTSQSMTKNINEITPRLYLMKGESGNLQLPLSTTNKTSTSSEIINLAAEYIFFFSKHSPYKTHKS